MNTTVKRTIFGVLFLAIMLGGLLFPHLFKQIGDKKQTARDVNVIHDVAIGDNTIINRIHPVGEFFYPVEGNNYFVLFYRRIHSLICF